jgi:general secretion pathway protein E
MVKKKQTSNKRGSLRRGLARNLLLAIQNREDATDDEITDYPIEMDGILHDAVGERATDLHLDTQADGVLVRMRVDGRVLNAAFLDHAQGLRLINQFKTLTRLNTAMSYLPEEGRARYALDGQTLDIRLSHAPCLHGDRLSIRLFTTLEVPQQLNELGLHNEGIENIRGWLDDMSGMLLVVGPTGCGKTTTLYAMLHKLKLDERNIVTIEDPVEYEVDGISHIQVDEKHGLDFPEGIKAMLRMDPDYVLVGEIRDAFSARAAITAAGSGHALMSTLHSRDAVGVVDILRNFGMTGHEISANLMLVISQRLVRLLCTHCREETTPDEEETSWLKLLGREVPKKVWRARGCNKCHDTGYHGRTGVFEIWRIDPDEYQMILEDRDRRTIYRHLAQRGHCFMLDDGLDKVVQGITSMEELYAMGGASVLRGIDQLPSDLG